MEVQLQMILKVEVAKDLIKESPVAESSTLETWWTNQITEEV
jgi:hypothetical protein